MSILDPTNLTLGDLCNAAMQECGRLGTGQSASAEDMTKAWSRFQFMLQEWQVKRWLVYHLKTFTLISTGATSYTFGPGGQINTNLVSAWELESLAPLSGLAGTGYIVGEILTLAAQGGSGTPTAAQMAQVTEVDSAGAVVAVQIDLGAVGSIQFASNPVPGDTVTLNGTVWTFVAGTAVGNQTKVLATADLTVAQLAVDLSASAEAALTVAGYSVSGTLAGTNLKLQILYDATGVVGNAYSLAASSATVSGGSLSGGATNATLYPGPLPSGWSVASTTGVGWNLVLGFPVWAAGAGVLAPRGSQRPPKIESAFLRQIQTDAPNQVDYFLDILQSHEDYDKIALKNLQSFPGAIFLDSDSPLGNLFCYPVPQADIYSINVTVMQQLQTSFATLNTVVNLPWEYYSAILYNLALRLRSTFQIIPMPGDQLPGLANNALNVLRGPNTQIARLRMPEQMVRSGAYNIFSDRNY